MYILGTKVEHIYMFKRKFKEMEVTKSSERE